MKQNSIQYLLEKYREGTLTDDERTELERLSHRDEVMATASRRATGIVWRRVSLTIGAVAVLGVGATLMIPRPVEEVMIAEAHNVPAAVQMASETEQVLRPMGAHEAEIQQVAESKAAMKPVAKRPTTMRRSATKKKSDPVVVCNNQCDADSVISDIKRFLSV